MESLLASQQEEIQGNWKLPEWYLKYRSKILENLPPIETLRNYAIFHDCGKPFCKTEDSSGKVHFPDHAEVSYRTWLSLYPEDKLVADLIRNDMKLHVIKGTEIECWCATTHKQIICSLLLSALAEIHSNAKMFGGVESESFKIKWKHLDRRGKAICKILFES